MLFEEYNRYKKTDIAKDALITAAMILIFYIYWAAVLLLASVVFLNVWNVTLAQICLYAAVLTAVCAAVYVCRLVRKRRKGIF